MKSDAGATLREIEKHLASIIHLLADMAAARLSNGAFAPALPEPQSGGREQPTPKDAPQPGAAQTMTRRSMVIEALEDARSRGTDGLWPAEIRIFINDRYQIHLGGTLNATASTMWRSGLIDKDRTTGKYRLRRP